MDKEFETFMNSEHYKEISDKIKDRTPYVSKIFPKIFYGAPYETRGLSLVYRVCGSHNPHDSDYGIFLYMCEEIEYENNAPKIKESALKELVEVHNLIVDIKDNICTTQNGTFVGNIGYAWYITHVLGLSQLQSADGNTDHTVCIGFNEKRKQWCGWSHRAIEFFGIGSVADIPLINSEYIDKSFVAKTMDDAKKIAIAFAKSVD